MSIFLLVARKGKHRLTRGMLVLALLVVACDATVQRPMPAFKTRGGMPELGVLAAIVLPYAAPGLLRAHLNSREGGHHDGRGNQRLVPSNGDLRICSCILGRTIVEIGR
jgi:hypothetical protein